MKITDEMIEVFGDEWQAAREFEEVLGNDRWFVPSGYKRKRALEAVLPLIETAVRKELAESLRNMRTVDDNKPVPAFHDVADWLEEAK